ncbi:MAG TPA: acyl-CoA dehydrogenase family protein [Acidimicrobiales bacterium]|nr:acyl-CoA dehydrogenase family protein [Acidimicrobiales bacterium]
MIHTTDAPTALLDAPATGGRELPDLLRPVITEHASQADRDRRLPAALVDPLRSAGAFRLTTPAAYRGFELSLVDLVEVYEAFGAIDASVAWNVWNGSCGFSAALLDPLGADEIWGHADPIVANSARPAGQARIDGDELVLSGRWDIVSAIDVADWAVLFGMVLDGDAPAMVSGHPDVRAFFLRRDQIEVLDTWHTTGMRGTGSNTVVVDAARVPSYLAVDPFAPPRLDAPRYRIPAFTMASIGAAPIVIGIAQATIDEVVAMATTKGTDNGQVLALRPHAHSQLAAAQTALDAARLLLVDAARRIDEAAEADEPVTELLRSRLRAAMSHAAKTVRDVLGTCQGLASSTAIYTDNPIEQLLRDGSTATQHMILAETHLDIYGRLLVGQPAGTPLV